jgi:iron complex outermembrane receptor protein
MFNVSLLSRNLSHHLDLSASMYNLFNRTYFDPGAGEHRQDALQQDGRNFRIKMTWRWAD